MNSSTYLYLVKFGPFYIEFGVRILVKCYYHHERCVDLVGGSGVNFREFTPCPGIVAPLCLLSPSPL